MNTNANICGVKQGNTGTSGCALDFSQINGFIITPDTKTYTMSGYATDALFLAALKADTLLASKSARIYPYFRVIDCVDNTPANTVQATAYGIHQHTELGKPGFTLTLAERGIRQVQNISRFMGNNGIRMFLTDKKGGIYGQKTAAGLFMGFAVDVAAEALKMPAGMNTSEKKMNVYLQEEDAILNPDKLEYYVMDSGTMLKDELSGVHDVKLSLVSASTTVWVIKAQRADNLKDLGIENEAALEQVGAWLSVIASTGVATAAPTSVVYSSTEGTLTLTWAVALGTVLHYLSLKDPTVLAALATPFGNGQTGGYESNVLSVTPS